ncbi:MAG: LTA synthase family protein [Cellulosilyticaceae bacterium]
MILGMYLVIALFWMESILRWGTLKTIGGVGIFYSFLFALPIALLIYSVTSFTKGKKAYVISGLFMIVSATLYASQLVYYDIFERFYTVYSAGNAMQIMSFWKDALGGILRNLPFIVLLYVPAILFIVAGRKKASWKTKNLEKVVGIIGIMGAYMLGVGCLQLGATVEDSPYQLYYKQRNFIGSVEKLGLMTTMRLDLQRMITGWEPTLYEEEADIEVAWKEEIHIPNLETPTEEKVEKESVEKEIKEVCPQVLPIDFESLIQSTINETHKKMHQYFKEQEPTTTNDYTGKYEGYNLIFLTAEAFSPYAVDEILTPTLYKMVHEGYYFKEFYNPLWEVSTSDGEYVACTGLIPKSGVWSFYESGDNYMPFVMGNQLQNKGYMTKAYHNHTYDYYKRHISHPNMGYDYKGLGSGLEVKKTWPESDLEMMEKTIEEYVGAEPFHAYYMTVSGHMNYTFTGNSMSYKNRDLVKDLPYSEAGKAYIACQIELDRALEYLLQSLEEKGVLDKTLIALSADHYPYGLEQDEIEELAGKDVEENFELYKSPFILYTPQMEPMVIEKPCSSLDVLPTLSNLMGVAYDSRLLMGRDIFSKESPLVMFYNKSFITDKGYYDSRTKTFTTTVNEAVSADYVQQKIKEVANKFYYSAKILEEDYYGVLLDPEHE